MQVFGNVATQPELKKSKSTNKSFVEFRLAESQRGVDTEPTWYTVRVMKDAKPQFDQGDFVKVTGKLKTDFYLSREGKPTGTLLILAFEAAKIGKASSVTTEVTGKQAQNRQITVAGSQESKDPPFDSCPCQQTLQGLFCSLLGDHVLATAGLDRS